MNDYDSIRRIAALEKEMERLRRLPVPVSTFLNVKTFGAVGDGVTDDRVAIQAALDAIRLNGNKATLYFPPGTYVTSTAPHPNNAGLPVCLVMGANTTLQGSARGQSVILLKAAQAERNAIVMNYTIGSATDQNLIIRDLTFDGNAANQAAIVTFANRGIYILRARHVHMENVHVRNVRGLNAAGNGEGFDIQVTLSADVTHRNCICEGGATSSTGFTVDTTLNATYVACEAYGHGIAHGFTNAGCQNVTHHGCMSYSNTAGYGFNTENSAQVSYHSCMSGGISPNTAGWYAANTARANAVGFVVLNNASSAGPVHLVGCTSNRNTAQGLYVNGGANVHVVGGIYNSNGSYGIDVITATGMSITGRPQLAGNPSGNLHFDAFTAQNYPQGINTIAVPGVSGTVTPNPLPCDVLVSITGGTVTGIDLGGNATGRTSGTFIVPAGGTITLTYTAAPTWTWITI